MSNLGVSPLYLNYKNRYDAQPQEIRDKLDSFRSSDFQLKVIKRKNAKINLGDVFVLSPRENIYFYGKVLKTDIKTTNKDSFIEGKQTIFIHKCKTNRIELDGYKPNYEDLLINPSIVDISYWKRGLFYNVGNIPLTDIEKSLDYGFYKSGIPGIRDGWFCTEEGKKLDKEPRIMGMYAIATIIGIAAEVETELIMNPSLLE